MVGTVTMKILLRNQELTGLELPANLGFFLGLTADPSLSEELLKFAVPELLFGCGPIANDRFICIDAS